MLTQLCRPGGLAAGPVCAAWLLGDRACFGFDVQGNRRHFAYQPEGNAGDYHSQADAHVDRANQRFARRFLKETGTRAVIGYATTVDWMASLVADMLFLHRFYSDPSPWKNLRRIFASVQRDYPRARRLGHVLITA